MPRYFQPQRIKLGPRVLPNVGINIGTIDETEGIAGEEGAGFEVAVAEAFIEESGGVFFLGVGAVWVGIAAPLGVVRVWAGGSEGMLWSAAALEALTGEAAKGF